MVSPKQLDFSSSGGVGDSDAVTLSRRKSTRTPSSKRTAPPEVTKAEEETKTKKQKMSDKKKKKKKDTKTKLSPPNRIWNEEDEVTLLKGFVDYKVMTGLQTKTDWDGFYGFLGGSIGGSIVATYSKDQVHSKIRKLKSKYLVQMEKINQGKDPNFSDSEIFGYSEMIWGQEEAAMDKEQAHDEPLNDNKAVKVNATARQAQLSADDEPLNENEAVAENATAQQGQQNENGEEKMKEHDEEADVECTDTNDGKEVQGDNDEFIVVQDAFETLMSQGLSGYEKKLHLEKLLNIETDKRRELSDEWNDLCAEKRRLNLKKLRYSVKFAEALSDS